MKCWGLEGLELGSPIWVLDGAIPLGIYHGHQGVRSVRTIIIETDVTVATLGLQ